MSEADTGLVSVAACPRCSTALGLSRWCGTCGLDQRSDLPPVDIPEARMAGAQERRWLSADPAALAVAPAVAAAPPAFAAAPPAFASPPPAFLPPTGATAPVVAAPPAGVRFAPLRMRSLLAIRWLWFAIAMGLAALGIDAMWLQEQASPDWTVEELVSVSTLMDATAIAQLVTYTIGAVIFIAWFHRAYGNLRALGVPKPRHGRGWVIGSWFVPLANLFLPKQLTNDVWRAGDPDLRPGDPGWQARPVAAIVHWWWALWLIGGAVYRLSASLMTEAETIEAFRVAVMFDAASQVIGIASAVLAILVVKHATGRQEARARLLEAPGATPV